MRNDVPRSIREARRALGEAIRRAREEAALRRIDVSKSMGYQNLSKGAWRLSTWEKGEAAPATDHIARLRQVLPVPDLDALIAAERSAVRAWAAERSARAAACMRGA